jgi:peptidoglycan hydrolase-like protein with peptidoglycan-binding domain
MATIPKNLLSPCSMKRIICHWSEGNYKANSTDLEHYHILIEGDGTVRGGDYTILDNLSTSDGNYAAHTLGTNTGSIGVACCGMAGCQESPFKPGSQALKKSQWDVMVQVVAELCQFYGIPVTPTTVLGHGEVQANLGIKQKGKWDPMVWPWDTSKTRKQVGAGLREQVSSALAQPGGRAPRVATRTNLAAAVDGGSYTLRSALLANDFTLRRIGETSLVLVPQQHPEPVSGIEAIQEAINRLATTGMALPRISFGAGDKFRGWFGPQTANALRAFQRLAGIDVDAKIGDDTLRALDNALVSAGVGGLMPGAPTRQPKASPVAKKTAAAAPTPAGEFVRTRIKVLNRGIPPMEFLQELVAWGKTASEEIFADKKTEEKDLYASVKKELGPFNDILNRKAVMLEVMRVLAGFESSWKWNTGRDTTNPDEDSPDTISAGPFQVSANSMGFGQDLRDLIAPHGICNAKRDGTAFQVLMKTDHIVAFNYISRLLRHTIRHNGPVKRCEINPCLSRDAAKEFQQLLTA